MSATIAHIGNFRLFYMARKLGVTEERHKEDSQMYKRIWNEMVRGIIDFFIPIKGSKFTLQVV